MSKNSLNSDQERIENSIIGALLQFPSSLQIVDILEEDHFEIDKHKFIFEAIKQLKQTNKSIDLVTVTHQLKKNVKLAECGGAYGISQMTEKITSDANINMHAALLVENWMIRKFKNIGKTIIEKSDDPSKDIITLINHAQRAIEKLNTSAFETIKSLSNQDPTSVKLAVDKEVTAIMNDIKKGIAPGISYGFPSLDKAVTKMQPGDLIILAARPGMGKTILALTIAVYLAVELNMVVDFYSLEMSAKRLVHRILSMMVGISSDKIAERRLTPQEIEKLKTATDKLNHNMHIYDSSDNFKGITVEFVEFNIKRRGTQASFIDYLQLMPSETKASNREQEISKISRSLKLMASKHGLPIIALSQLNREAETRSSTQFRPKLSDLRESGAIEQDADIVLMIYRAAYYNFKGSYPENVTELIIGKSRHSKNAGETVALWFDEKELCFKNYVPEENTLFDNNFDSDEEQPF